MSLRLPAATLVLFCCLVLGLGGSTQAAAGAQRPQRPVVLLFHAGGLLVGDIGLMDELKPAVRAAGMRPVPVDYALFDYPQAFADAEAAARRFRGRTVYAYGESAGGTLAGWLAGRHLVSAAAANSAIVNLSVYVRALKASNPQHVDLYEAASGGEGFVRKHSLEALSGEPLRLYGNCRDPVAPCGLALKYAHHYRRVSWRHAGVGHIANRVPTVERALAWFRAGA